MRLIYNKLKDLYPISVYVKLRKENDIVIVMNESLELNYLNYTSLFFLEKSTGKMKISEIVDDMLQEYDVTIDIIEKDIINLVRDLQWKKIIKLSKSKR